MSPFHDPVKAVFRSKNANPNLRSFVFEELPFKVRRRIFRELLLKPREFDVEMPIFDDECLVLDALVDDLLVDIGGEEYYMNAEIMRTNKKIHNEAAAVLYGENWFIWRIRTKCPRRYRRLITKMRLVIEILDFPKTKNRFWWISRSIQSLCKVFSSNDFKVLVVDYTDCMDFQMRAQGRVSCLEPLQQCRAQKVSIKECLWLFHC